MAKLERTYTIPLRKEYLKANRYRRAEKAVIAVKEFLTRHMKSENINLGKYLNQHIWKNGVRNPPHHVKVLVTKEDDGKVVAELADKPVEKTAKKVKAPAVKKVADKGAEEIKEELKKVEEKTEKVKSEKAKAAPKKAAKKE